MKTSYCCTVLSLLALCASASDVFKEDFEAGAGRWHLPSAQWSVVDGAGLDGSRALALKYGKGEHPRWIEENDMVRVEPGEAYRIEAWVNDSSFSSGHQRSVSISLAVYDVNGKLIRGAEARAVRVADNLPRKDGFYCVAGVSRPLPANAYKARFYIWAHGDSHGLVLFDGFRLHPIAVNPLDNLCCSCYRNEAAEGEISFSAGYLVNELKHDVSRLRAELRYLSTEGEKVVSARLSDGVASVTLPVSAFMFGTHKVSLSLKEGEKPLGESSCDFARLGRLPVRKVSFDKYWRTIVDGKPFFPLGMTVKDLRNAAKYIPVFTNASMNCVLTHRYPDVSELDICEAAGVKVCLALSGFYELEAGTNVQKAAEITTKHIRGQVEQFRSHPATLAWYLADELNTPYAKLLEARHRMCHEKDPDHPTFVVLNAPSKVRPFVNGYDCVAMDPYPIGYPNCFIGMASDWPLQAQRGMYRSRAMWQVPQAFNWASCFPPGLKMPKDVHMPTREEMRSMTWQAIAGGANGLIYYSFEGAYLQGGSEEENRRRWMDVCAVVSEVKAHESMLLSKPGPDVGNVPKGMVCRTWKTDDGKVRLLACNTEQKPIEGTVRIGGESVSISLPPIGVFIGRPVAVRRGKL